mmetsp:Transcript_24937/g.63509  ORF Transcript_24937/g.63509 Transcript_24937/m.63509 type:complete len:94 (+) Transcript_24937:1014-1295(+)
MRRRPSVVGAAEVESWLLPAAAEAATGQPPPVVAIGRRPFLPWALASFARFFRVEEWSFPWISDDLHTLFCSKFVAVGLQRPPLTHFRDRAWQ